MGTVVGLLIRRERLRRSLSQEGLCAGICAVSYLSKIERGQVTPGPELVAALFGALDIRYELDGAYLARQAQALEAYFTSYLFGGNEDERLAQALRPELERLLYSELHMQARLFETYELAGRGCAAAARGQLEALMPFEAEMDQDMAFLFWLACGGMLEDDGARERAFLRARALNPCSAAYMAYGEFLMRKGRLHEALVAVQTGYRVAADEGRPAMLRNLSLLEGNCYAVLAHEALMRKAFTRALRLSEGDVALRAGIQYNLGATLLEMGKREEGLAALLEAYAGMEEASPHNRMLCCHKLALAFEMLARREEGRRYLDEGMALAEAEDAIYVQMMRVAQMRYTDGYMNDNAYLTALEEVYEALGARVGFGFGQFHALLLIEVYTHRRQYKQALQIAMKIHHALV